MYTLVRTLCIIFFDENAAFFFYVQGDSIRGNESLSFRFVVVIKYLFDPQGTEKECRWQQAGRVNPICHIVS